MIIVIHKVGSVDQQKQQSTWSNLTFLLLRVQKNIWEHLKPFFYLQVFDGNLEIASAYSVYDPLFENSSQEFYQVGQILKSHLPDALPLCTSRRIWEGRI